MSEPVKIYDGAIDRGLEGVVACSTGISSIIDVTLCYRGYTIEDLAANSNFEEVSWLLWNGKLPNKSELESFKGELKKEMNLDGNLIDQLRKLPTNVHPMSWLRTATSMLAMWDPEAQDMSDAANRRKALRLTAKMGMLVALFQRIRDGKDFVQPNPDKSIGWRWR
jgi:citrate synthase